MSTLVQVRERVATYGVSSLTEREMLTLLKLPTGKTFAQLVQENNPQARAIMYLSGTQRHPRETDKIRSSNDVYKILRFLDSEPKEQFWVLLLNRGNIVKQKIRISIGSATACIVDVQEITRHAILHNARGVILAHNHPSGVRNPSDADKRITTNVKKALALFEIDLFDHVIIPCNIDQMPISTHYSFADEGDL